MAGVEVVPILHYFEWYELKHFSRISKDLDILDSSGNEILFRSGELQS